MTEERIEEIIKQTITSSTEYFLFSKHEICILMKQAVNEAIEEYKKKLLEEIDCCEPKDLTYPITFVYEDDINKIADQLKVK